MVFTLDLWYDVFLTVWSSFSSVTAMRSKAASRLDTSAMMLKMLLVNKSEGDDSDELLQTLAVSRGGVGMWM